MISVDLQVPADQGCGAGTQEILEGWSRSRSQKLLDGEAGG